MVNELPAWDDPALRTGTMARGALWLLSQVGVGNVFTKEQIREAFPKVTQADRRIRDLRKHGWRLDTNREDSSLAAGEQRFVHAGTPVWQRGGRSKETGPKLSAKLRSEIIAADDYQCVVCGIAGGESYSDRPSEIAVLSVSRRVVELVSGGPVRQFVTECKRCRDGTLGATEDAASLLREIDSLEYLARMEFIRWASDDRRPTSQVEKLWSRYRRLPKEARAEMLAILTASKP